jgi:hypothetical protein
VTRLQKDAMKELAVLLIAALAVGIAYVLTHDLIHSLCWFGLMGFLGVLAMFPTAEPGPVVERTDFPSLRARKTLSIMIPIAILAVCQGIFLALYRVRSILTWTPTLVFSAMALLRVWRNWNFIQLKCRLPKYDERELIVQQNAARISLGIFWVAFVLWGVAAGMLSDSHVWHLPGAAYAFQVFVAWWLVRTTHAIAVIWQERRAGE